LPSLPTGTVTFLFTDIEGSRCFTAESSPERGRPSAESAARPREFKAERSGKCPSRHRGKYVRLHYVCAELVEDVVDVRLSGSFGNLETGANILEGPACRLVQMGGPVERDGPLGRGRRGDPMGPYPKLRSNQLRIWLRGAGIIVVAVLWVANGDSKNGMTRAAPKPLSACSVVSVEDAKALLGAVAIVVQDVDIENPPGSGQRAAQCVYRGAGQKLVSASVVRPITKADFEAYRHALESQMSVKTQTLPGLGEEAFSLGRKDPAPNLGMVTLLRVDHSVSITVTREDLDPAQIVASIMPIARRVAGRPL
jgi:hypothetical protein